MLAANWMCRSPRGAGELQQGHREMLQREWQQPVAQTRGRQVDTLTDRMVVLEAVRLDGLALMWASEPLRADFEVVVEAVRQNGQALEWASKRLRSDRAVVFEAVSCSGIALRFASRQLRGDREIVIAAVRRDGSALQSATEDLRADRGVVLEAVQQDGMALLEASENLQADRDVVWQAVLTNGLALRYAAESLRADHGLVYQAVRQSGLALEWAAEELRANREMVLAAVKGNWQALRYASEELRSDAEIVLSAVRQSGWALQDVSPHLRADRALGIEAVRQNGEALLFLPPHFQADAQIVLEAVRGNGRALRFASEHLRADIEIVTEAVQQAPEALQFASAEMRAEEAFVHECSQQINSLLFSKYKDLTRTLSEAQKELKALRQDLNDKNKELSELQSRRYGQSPSAIADTQSPRKEASADGEAEFNSPAAASSFLSRLEDLRAMVEAELGAQDVASSASEAASPPTAPPVFYEVAQLRTGHAQEGFADATNFADTIFSEGSIIDVPAESRSERVHPSADVVARLCSPTRAQDAEDAVCDRRHLEERPPPRTRGQQFHGNGRRRDFGDMRSVLADQTPRVSSRLVEPMSMSKSTPRLSARRVGSPVSQPRRLSPMTTPRTKAIDARSSRLLFASDLGAMEMSSSMALDSGSSPMILERDYVTNGSPCVDFLQAEGQESNSAFLEV